MRWPADRIPAQFELRLSPAQHLSGRVTDESGGPVAGAEVTLVFPQRLAGPCVPTEDTRVQTDPNGTWSCDFVPKDAAYVRVEVTHPDFAMPEDEVPVEALRDGTAQFRLTSVVRLRGRVTDDTGTAVSGAQVALGVEGNILPGSSASETTTDAEGRFEFGRVHLQKRLLGVKADGAAPALRLVEVQRDLAPLEIRLSRGAPLRVRVVDEAGMPIQGVQVSVDEWPAEEPASQSSLPGRWYYPGWEWKTDADGRFVWSNAPPETALLTFRKGGYLSRGRQELRPSAGEAVVTLGPSFRGSGTVLDGTTGQPVPEFIVNARFVQSQGLGQTNFGAWHEYNRRQFTGGQFTLEYDSPLLSGPREMHDWQFRVEADGHAPALSRVLRDAERGSRLEFRLQPQPMPEMGVAAPSPAERVATGVAVQPGHVRPGETVTVFVKVRLAPGFHIYALEDSGGSNVPTTINASLRLRQVLEADSPWRGPEPQSQPDSSRTLAGDLVFQRRFLVKDHAQPGRYQLPLTVYLQVCNEALCWPPETIALETQLDVLGLSP